MAAARNMKELENMILNAVKDVVTKSIKTYTSKWYSENKVEAEKIITEEKLQEAVSKAFVFDICKGEFKTSIDITKYAEYGLDKHQDMMNKFKDGLLEYISIKLKKNFN
jgi:hypothetical protein